MPAVIPPHCGDPDHWDPINCPADRVNRPPLNTVAASAEDAVAAAAAAAVPDFKKAVFATNFTTNTTTNNNFTVDGVAALNRTAQANATVAPENPYQSSQFEYDARSMGFAIGILILVGAFFAYVLFADICSGKYRFKKRFRAAFAAKFQGEEGLPFWNKKNKGPQQQQTATAGQQMTQRSQSATGTVATGASGNTTTFVATSANPTPEPPAKASSDTNGKGKSNGGEATKTMTKATTASHPSNGTASTSAPAAAATSAPARASNGRSASAVSASSPVDLTLKTSNPPRIPTPAAISALDDGKRQSNNSLGRAVFSVFAK